MTKTINVGIIGAGGIAAGKHLPGHRNVQDVSVIAVCDIDEPRARRICQATRDRARLYGLQRLACHGRDRRGERVYPEQLPCAANRSRAGGRQARHLRETDGEQRGRRTDDG